MNRHALVHFPSKNEETSADLISHDKIYFLQQLL